MDRNTARAEAKRPERLEEYLIRKGIDPRKPFLCLNPAHNDHDPSMSFDRRRGRIKCFSCNATYDLFDLVALDYGLTDQRQIFDKAYEVLGLQIDDKPHKATAAEDFNDQETGQNPDKTGQYTHTHTDVYTHTDTHTHSGGGADMIKYYEACHARLGETGYPETRGLSREVLDRHMIGYDPAFSTKSYETGELVKWKALIIPTGRDSYQVRNTDPSAGHKDRYRKRGASQIFGYKALYTSASPIFVVEGEIDAMSVEEAGGAAVGLGSYDNVPILLKLLEEKKPTQPLLIAFDHEAEESKAARVSKAEEELMAGLERLQIPHYRINPYGEYKDANEALVGNREAFAAEIRGAVQIEAQAEAEAREAYMATSAGSHLQEFINGIAESANTDAIPTGFPALDKVLDGGLYEGLVTVGGISSLGKTSLIMQIADQVASAGNDVLIFSLEMSRSQLMSKSISRHTIQIARERKIEVRNAKTSRGITSGKRYQNYSRTELDLIHDSIEAYQEYADRIFIQEGIGDITTDSLRETVERHILYTGGRWETNEETGERRLSGGRRPLVIVDYLQIIAPHNDRATDKQVVDHAVLELKRISRDYKLPVIAISSFNRGGYKIEATFEQLKESGAIEYSSDIVLALQLKGAGEKNFDPTEAKRKNPREIELVVLKNRDAAVGDKVTFNYYPMFNLFDEVGIS